MRCTSSSLTRSSVGIGISSAGTGDTNLKKGKPKPRIAQETIDPIKQMISGKRLWGAERIRGELLKLASGRYSDTCRSAAGILVRPGPPSSRITLSASGRAISLVPGEFTKITSQSTHCLYAAKSSCDFTGPSENGSFGKRWRHQLDKRSSQDRGDMSFAFSGLARGGSS
jgi:hypothetical protein